MKYVVFYHQNLVMRERVFTDKTEAENFSTTVKGSICNIPPKKSKK